MGGDFHGSEEKEKSRKEKEVVRVVAGMESPVRETGFPSPQALTIPAHPPHGQTGF
jgi:hypothetical protein